MLSPDSGDAAAAAPPSYTWASSTPPPIRFVHPGGTEVISKTTGRLSSGDSLVFSSVPLKDPLQTRLDNVRPRHGCEFIYRVYKLDVGRIMKAEASASGGMLDASMRSVSSGYWPAAR